MLFLNLGHDEEGYQRYALAEHLKILYRFQGKLTVINCAADVLEGLWPFNRTVVMAFPSGASQAFYNFAE